MAETADVVIVGAGIVGASVAHHLAVLGCRNVLLVEREAHQGKGSTGKSMGGVRAQFATDINIRMSLYSIPFFARFEEITGHPSGYKPHGYLFVASSARHLDYLRANFVRQKALGLEGVEILGAPDIGAMVPQLRGDDIVGGSFCPTDGFVDPYSVMTGFTQSALRSGVRLWRGVEVTAIERSRGRVAGVRTTAGDVATPVVIDAAGPWAAQAARLAGVELPVEPLRRMLVPTEPFAGLPERLPMVIDMRNGFHFRREGQGLLLAWADPDERPGFRSEFDPEFIEKILSRAVDRVPAFADLQVNPKRAWWGHYEVSPDHHAILGPCPDLEGLFFANGFSGHGVMHSPATGCVLAEWVLFGRPRTIDATPLAVTRFAEGKMIHETAVL